MKRHMRGRRPAGAVGALVLLLAATSIPCGCAPRSRIQGAPPTGGIFFAVTPPDALVVLDGVPRGTASEFTLERYLPAEGGTHRLTLRKPGFKTYAREVYVSDSLLRIETTLERVDAPAAEGY